MANLARKFIHAGKTGFELGGDVVKHSLGDDRVAIVR
jgi:hypothetical protein